MVTMMIMAMMMMNAVVGHYGNKKKNNSHLDVPEETSDEQYTPARVSLRIHECYLANVVTDHAE